MRSISKAVFLDRDGVINKYPGDKAYVTSRKGFRFLPRVKKALAKLSRSGFKIFVVSNQAGVDKGIFSKTDLDAITGYMLSGIRAAGGRIDAVYYCTHRAEKNCLCRKPKTGMIKTAQKNFKLNLKQSFFVGDTIRDVITAKSAGCKSILVLSGKEKLRFRKDWEVQPAYIFKDLWEAVAFIVRQKK